MAGKKSSFGRESLLKAGVDAREIHQTLSAILRDLKGLDGGVSPFGKDRKCDVCVNGMFLNYASYFGADEGKLCSIVDFLITEHMPDGGTTFCGP